MNKALRCFLDGEKIRLESLTVDGVKLNDYELSPDGLTLPSVPSSLS